MRVFLTGAAGFIGSHFALRLLKEGHTVMGIDNFDPFYDIKLKTRNLKQLSSHPLFQFQEADIRDELVMAKIFNEFKPDRVVHLAARAGVRPSIEFPSLYVDVNVRGTAVLLDSLVKWNPKTPVIMASSSSVYGNSLAVPFTEADPVNEPVSPYAATKKANEVWCYNVNHLYQTPIVMVRFFTVYGPAQRPEMAIHQFIRKIDKGEEITLFGDGSTSRDYTYVDDIVSGMMGMLNFTQGYEVVNLGATDPISLKGLVDMIAKAVGKEPKIRWAPLAAGDVERTFADISKAKRLFGYQPTVQLKEGIRRFVEWYRENDSR